MKNIIKKLLREILLENTPLINSILDKINDSGMNSLTDYEKSVLNAASQGKAKHKTMEDDIYSFLDEKFGGLNVEFYKKKSFGVDVYGYYFIDYKGDLSLELELYRRPMDWDSYTIGREAFVLFIDYGQLNEIQKKYNINDAELDKYIKNWFMNSDYIEHLKYNEKFQLPDNFDIKKVSMLMQDL